MQVWEIAQQHVTMQTRFQNTRALFGNNQADSVCRGSCEAGKADAGRSFHTESGRSWYYAWDPRYQGVFFAVLAAYSGVAWGCKVSDSGSLRLRRLARRGFASTGCGVMVVVPHFSSAC